MLLTWEFDDIVQSYGCFNGHPPLGVNATIAVVKPGCYIERYCFNGHPPLGVNATLAVPVGSRWRGRRFIGHPPLGVNATTTVIRMSARSVAVVSLGTHPWG